MTQYINKSVVVAEIKRRINEINLDTIEDWRYRLQREHDIEIMKNILSLIDTFEVKEADLEKVFDDEYSKFSNDVDAMDYSFPIDLADYRDFAKHFFELGLKAAQKGE
jgi:hypothetical protein